MTKKIISICTQCIAKAKATELNSVEVGKIATCHACGKYGFLRQLNEEQVEILRVATLKESDRRAKSVKAFQKAKAEKELEKEKTRIVRKPVKLKSISLT